MTYGILDSRIELKRMALKKTDEGMSVDVGVFEGYASTFGNEDRYGDVIERGAFSRALQDPVPLLWQHDMRAPIGIIAEWEQDDRGLRIMGEINLETERGKDAFNLLRAGHVKFMSVGFMVNAEEEDKRKRRIIKDATLVEVSLVTIPANPQAAITEVRTFEDVQAFSRACMTGMPFELCKGVLQSHATTKDDGGAKGIDELAERLRRLDEKFKALG